MKKIIALLATLLVGLAVHAADADANRATPPEAEAMVKKAIANYKVNGQELFFPNASDPSA